MKVKFTWKDPSWYECIDEDELTEDQWDRLKELGIGEYLTLEVDLITGEVGVVK